MGLKVKGPFHFVDLAKPILLVGCGLKNVAD